VQAVAAEPEVFEHHVEVGGDLATKQTAAVEGDRGRLAEIDVFWG
jgi:hypothetical protein